MTGRGSFALGGCRCCAPDPAADFGPLPCPENGVAAAIRALALGKAVPGVKPLR